MLIKNMQIKVSFIVGQKASPMSSTEKMNLAEEMRAQGGTNGVELRLNRHSHSFGCASNAYKLINFELVTYQVE